MNTYFHETELIGGPLDGQRTRHPWIPLSGLQIVTTAGIDNVARYEWAGTKIEVVNHTPQFRYQLKFCGYHRSSFRAGCDAVRNLICWFRNFPSRHVYSNTVGLRDGVAQG